MKKFEVVEFGQIEKNSKTIKEDALHENEIHREIAEFKRLGHPDRLADSIALCAGAALLELDPAARFDIQAVLHYGPISAHNEKRRKPLFSCENVPVVVLGGQIATNASESAYGPAINKAVLDAIHSTGHDYDNYNGIDLDRLIIIKSFNPQSSNIAAGIDRDGLGHGAGDATIVHGYASSQTKNYLTASHALAFGLANALDNASRKGEIPGLGPDGKVQCEVSYKGSFNTFSVGPLHAENVVVAVQHEDFDGRRFRGMDGEAFKDFVVQLVRSADMQPVTPSGKRLLLVDSKTDIIINGAGDFVIGGPAADTGVSGRMDSLYVSGTTRRYGGGLLFSRDPTKTDFSCQLIARNIALNLVAGGIAKEASVTITYAIGKTAPESVSVIAEGCKYTSEQLTAAVKKAYNLSPDGIVRHLSIIHRDYSEIASKGLFGISPNGTHSWEKVHREKLDILKKALRTSPKTVLKSGTRRITQPS